MAFNEPAFPALPGRATERRRESTTPTCTRREFVRSVAVMTVGLGANGIYGAVGISSPKMTDIRIERVTFSFDDYRYRAPVKFAGALMDRATLLTVECTVRTRA